LHGEQVNIDLVKAWLGACENTHEPCGSQDWHVYVGHMEGTLRLIDVQDMCLVDGPVSDRYVALSYVWGAVPTLKTSKAVVAALYAPGALWEVWKDIPQTIRDGVDVVRKLG
jgi:hypothetical protein